MNLSLILPQRADLFRHEWNEWRQQSHEIVLSSLIIRYTANVSKNILCIIRHILKMEMTAAHPQKVCRVIYTMHSYIRKNNLENLSNTVFHIFFFCGKFRQCCFHLPPRVLVRCQKMSRNHIKTIEKEIIKFEPTLLFEYCIPITLCTYIMGKCIYNWYFGFLSAACGQTKPF